MSQTSNSNNSNQLNMSTNGNIPTTSIKPQDQNSSQIVEGTPKPVIERGASWSYNETRILLSLWGQDMVQRQLTNSKRTRHVWEKIAEKIKEHGFDRTAEQVRTRVFNMIAEYRRILKNPSPERKKKCIFFDALHKIYQAKDANGVRQALNNYEEEYNLEPLEFNTMNDTNDNHFNDQDQDNSGSENEDKSEVFSYALSPSHFNAVNMNGMNNDHVSSDGHEENEVNGSIFKRARTENSSSMNGNYQSQYSHTNGFDLANSYDHNASAILIDRMFSHLTKETEVMREWVVLERERLSQEISRRKEDNDREERREKSFLSILMKMQEQMFNFLSRNQLVKDVNGLNNTNGNTSSLTNGQINSRNDHLNGINDHNGDYDEDMN